MLSDLLVVSLQQHLKGVKRLYSQDLERGQCSIDLPFALVNRKYPNDYRDWGWQAA